VTTSAVMISWIRTVARIYRNTRPRANTGAHIIAKRGGPQVRINASWLS
jgi:hypothetical protein